MITLILQFVMAILATLAFAVLFSAPARELLSCGVIGAVGWIIYYVMVGNGFNAVVATASAAIVLTILSRALAVIRRNPATMYIIPGIFPLVPGTGIYYTAYYIFNKGAGNASARLILTFELAAAIVVGIVIGMAIPQDWLNLLNKNYEDGKPENAPEGRTLWGEER